MQKPLAPTTPNDTLEFKERNGYLGCLLDEVETDQASEETDEVLNINQDGESKFQKSNEHETSKLKGKFPSDI
ncbi:hypothetical protein TNCV_1627281 [Trichonephila clavipes]|nr:hypothetical protein TNCV_1627281 [Trichonephila clavipes]